jgi:polyisoprenoid-binding protein YceI
MNKKMKITTIVILLLIGVGVIALSAIPKIYRAMDASYQKETDPIRVKHIEQIAATETYTVDATHSAALFQVKHFGISFVSGRFTDLSGTIGVDRENLNNSSVEIVIRTASVNTDLKERDEHLRNADFLDVKKYPTMSFKSSQVRKINDNLGEITGSFTLHGVTKTITTTVTFLGEVDVPWGQHRAGFETSFNIKRSDYGMDKLLGPAGDNIQIILFVEAMRIDNSEKKVSD